MVMCIESYRFIQVKEGHLMNKEFLEYADKLVDKSSCESISKTISRDIRRYSRKILDTKDLKNEHS